MKIPSFMNFLLLIVAGGRKCEESGEAVVVVAVEVNDEIVLVDVNVEEITVDVAVVTVVTSVVAVVLCITLEPDSVAAGMFAGRVTR